MANPIPKPILGAFEDIGEQVASQIKQIPKDVGQAALESVGMNMGGTTSGQAQLAPGATQDAGSSWKQIEQQTDEKAKREIARNALQELVTPSATKAPSVWEQMQQEEAQKKEAKQQQQTAQASQLPMPTGKPKKAGMYGIKAKQQGSEIGKNVKHD